MSAADPVTISKEAQEFLDQIWERAMQPPDDREIWDWLTEEGELPNCYAMPGPLDISGTPFVKEPWQALRHPFVREVVAMAGIQCLKTFIGEGWLLWGIENDPGPTQWLQPTDQEAREHAEERFLPLIDNFERIKRFFTGNRHDQKTAVILFLHMWMRFEGCGAGNLQRKSVKKQMCSEVWQKEHWNPGSLDEAAARLTQFTFNSKRYIESQPGEVERDEDGQIVGDQILMAYNRGTQKQWGFRCLGCSRLQPFLWSYQRPDGSHAAMRWDTTERTRKKSKGVWGEWIWGELVQTIRYECIFCGHRHYDEPLTRRRISTNGAYGINRGGIWVPQEIGSFAKESFSWNQLAVPSLNWFETDIGGVRKFLIARDRAKKGFDGLMRQFMQKVMGEAFDPMKWSHFSRLPVVDIQIQGPSPGQKPKIELEGIVFDVPMMGVDVQKDHFFALIQYWNANEDILNVWAGKLLTWQEVREKQIEFKVPDEDVMVDESHRGIETIQNCTRHGHWVHVVVCGKCNKQVLADGTKWKHIDGTKDHDVEPQRTEPVWLCWKAMRGADRDWFTWVPTSGKSKGKRVQLVYGWPVDRGNPCSGIRADDPVRKELAGRDCPLITWARPTLLDFAIARRDGNVEGVKLLTVKGDWNKELSRQWFSQRKVLDRNTFGQTRWRWKNTTDDHLFDCFLMIAVRKFMKQGLKGLLGTAPSGEEKKAA